MPKKDNLLRAVSRKRQKAMCLQIPAPTDRHFDVPDEFAPFPLQDSGKDDKERILIFRDVTMKNLLNLSNTWLVDGTFKLSPEIFYQIYTIHVELNGFAPPCVYVLLPNKTEKTYNRTIEMLSEETNPNPGKVLEDFEKAALNAFSKKFPHAEISCCYFHLTQSFNRKINEIGENLLRKFSRIQLGTSNVTCSGTCSARPCKSIFWACYWGNNRRYRKRTVRRKCRRKNGWACNIFQKYIYRKPNC